MLSTKEDFIDLAVEKLAEVSAKAHTKIEDCTDKIDAMLKEIEEHQKQIELLRTLIKDQRFLRIEAKRARKSLNDLIHKIDG